MKKLRSPLGRSDAHSRAITLALALTTGLFGGCGPGTEEARAYCDPDHFVRIDLPTGWSAAREIDRKSANVRLVPPEGAPESAEFVVTITPGTDDAKKLDTAANQLGMVLAFGTQNTQVRPLELSHPVYDTSSATTDDGVSIVHMVWMVLQDADHLQIVASATAADDAPENLARLTSIVNAIEHAASDCRPE